MQFLTDKQVDWIVRRRPFEVSFIEVPIARLPVPFQGWTIVQVSDLHIDRWNTAVVEAAIETVNRLKADLLVCTGDVIASGNRYLPDVTHLLSRMQARYGKLACLGNHDYSDGSASRGVLQALRQAQFDVLVNESTTLTVQNRQIQLAGADDLLLGCQCLKTTHRRLDASQPTILLSHNPENFEAVAHFQPDLVLSGHTHGGQIQLPNGVHQRLINSPYRAGLYEATGSRLYVNRGLGSAVIVSHLAGHRIALPTPRLGIHPEISVFRLVNPNLEQNAWRSDRPVFSKAS